MCPSRVLYQFTTRSKRVLFRDVVLARVSLEPCIDDFVLSLEEVVEMRGHRGLDHASNKRNCNSVFAAERPLALIEIPLHGAHALSQVRTDRDRLSIQGASRLKVPGTVTHAPQTRQLPQDISRTLQVPLALRKQEIWLRVKMPQPTSTSCPDQPFMWWMPW